VCYVPHSSDGKVRPLLLEHHRCNGTATVDRLTVATKCYGPEAYCSSDNLKLWTRGGPVMSEYPSLLGSDERVMGGHLECGLCQATGRALLAACPSRWRPDSYRQQCHPPQLAPQQCRSWREKLAVLSTFLHTLTMVLHLQQRVELPLWWRRASPPPSSC
jgi:hypothetical protein